MKQNEAIKTIEKYFSKEANIVSFWGDKNPIMEIGDAISDGQMFFGDAPDLVIINRGILYAIEHFEIDCFKKSRKGGSTYHIEKSKIDKKIENIKPTDEGIMTFDCIDAESSFEYFINNTTYLFKKHYNQIPKYMKHIETSNFLTAVNEIKFGFLIEDVSPLGTTVFDRKRDEMNSVNLAQSVEFLDLLKLSKKVDFTIVCSKTGRQNSIWVIDRTNLSDHYKHTINYKSMQFLNFKPRVVSFQKLVPKGKFKIQGKDQSN